MKTLIIFLVILLCPVLKADWSQTSTGLSGGSVKTIFSNSTKLYAGTAYSGVYVSYDSGGTFIRRNNSLPGLDITSFAVKDTYLFAAVYGSGIYRTTNDGLNWTSANAGLQSFKITSLATTSAMIFAATSDSGIYASSNGGTSWFSASNGIQSSGVNSMTVTNDVIFAACTYQGVFRSTDNGANWTNCYYSSTGIFTSIASKDSVLFLGGLIQGVRRSTDLGITWQSVPAIVSSVYSLAYDGQIVFAGGGGGPNNIYASTNMGSDWYPASNGLPGEYAQTSALHILGSNCFAGVSGDGSGLYKSIDRGGNWYFSFNNTEAVNVNVMYNMNGRVFAGMRGQGISYTDNSGSNWTNISGGLGSSVILSIGSCDSFLFIGTYAGNYRSTNSGMNWLTSNLGLSEGSTAFISEGSTLMSGGYAPYKSTDHGLFWFPSASGFYSGGGKIKAFAKILNYTFVVNYNTLHMSPNFGEFWVQLANPWFYSEVNAMISSEDYLYVGHRDSGVYRSYYNGANWLKLNNGLSSLRIQALHANANKVFVGTPAGVFASTNRGINWIAINDGLGNLNVTSFASNNIYLFAGTDGSGVWRILLSDILTNIVHNEIPAGEFRLNQNYPNPFNPSTTLTYEIPVETFVRVKVFDVSGKEVMTLVNELKKAGKHEVNLQGDDLPSGVYFYKIEAGSFHRAKAMILIR